MKKQDTLENQVNYAYLAFGSNLGDRKKNLNKALKLLNKENIVIKKKSKSYKSKSWPNEKFPEFINFVIFIETSLNLKKLFLKIKNIESKVGRVKSKRNFPRVCDIDIIDFNGKVYNLKKNNQNLSIPHKSMHLRNFVLFPLFEISKNWSHPILKRNIKDLIFSLPTDELRTIKLI